MSDLNQRPLNHEQHSSSSGSVYNDLKPSTSKEFQNNNDDSVQKDAHANWTAFTLCTLVAFGGFVFGWDTGTISGFVNMHDFQRRFGDLHESGEPYIPVIRTGLIVSIFNAGCAIGGLTLGKLADRLGRKKCLMITMLVYVIGIIIQIASGHGHWYQYMIGRIISGLAVGSVSVVCPMFISETAPSAMRGSLVSIYQLMITLGIFLGYCTTYGTDHGYNDSRQWRIPLGLCFAWALLLLNGLVFMPESPRYLLQVGRVDEALTSFSKINSCPKDSGFVQREIETMRIAISEEKEASTHSSFRELFSSRHKMGYRLLVGVIIHSLQQLTGDNYFFYYGTTIFKSVGLRDSFVTSIILGVVNFVSTFAAFYVVDRFGRRSTLIGGSIGMAICLLIYSIVGTKALYPHEYGVDANKPAGDVMIVFTCLFIMFFAITWAPTTFVVVSETYPLRLRARGMAIASAANWIWGFLIGFFTPLITKEIHFAYGYVFFGCVLFSLFFVYFGIPETKGLSLEEVDGLYDNFTPGLGFMSSRNKIRHHDEEENAQAAAAQPSGRTEVNV